MLARRGIPMDLLILLLENRGDLVRREEIVARLWGKDTFLDAENAVNTAVRKLRHALRDSIAQPAFIQTVSGKGYRFIAPVTPELDEPAPPQTQIVANARLTDLVENGNSEALARYVSGPRSGQADRAASAGRRKLAMVTVLAAVLVLALGIYISPGWHANSKVFTAPVTIAVLPFVNLTGDSQEYFVDGLTEETIAVLGKVNPTRISVIARTSSMVYKRHEKTASQIGQELGADYLLEGSARREQARLRVTVKLIRVRDQSWAWSETYDRISSSIIGIQDEIGSDIARQIHVQLSPGEMIPRKQTRTLDAYDPYLFGRHFWNQTTQAGIRKSIEYFQTAVARDPSYALAFAGLADAYTILPITSDEAPRDSWLLAQKAAQEAVRLDDSLAEAHAAAGLIDFWLGWDWASAEKRLRRAVELSPNYASAHRYYAHLLANSGRQAEAAAEIQKARKLDPFSPITHTMTGQFLYFAGRYEEAIEPVNKAFAIDPSFWVAHIVMGKIHERSGRPTAAIESLEKAYEFSGGNTEALSIKGYVLATNGRRGEARQVLDGLIKSGQSRFVPPYNVALVYAGLGDPESALEWLNKAYDARDAHVVFLTVDPKWNDLRSHPRFKQLLKRCGFVLP